LTLVMMLKKHHTFPKTWKENNLLLFPKLHTNTKTIKNQKTTLKKRFVLNMFTFFDNPRSVHFVCSRQPSSAANSILSASSIIAFCGSTSNSILKVGCIYIEVARWVALVQIKWNIFIGSDFEYSKF
jgi:hypothetical protein